MAIRATNVALSDFVEDALPSRTILQHGANISGFLASDVIELHDDWIYDSAIDARFTLKIFHEQFTVSSYVPAPVDVPSRIMFIAVSCIVTAAVFTLTGPTV